MLDVCFIHFLSFYVHGEHCEVLEAELGPY